MRRRTKGPKRRGKPHRFMAVQDDSTAVSSDKNNPSSQKSCTKVVNQVVSSHSRKEYESDSFFMDIGTYCQICYNSNHVTLGCCHLKQGTQFVRSMNRNNKARFGSNGDHRRQMQYRASRYSPPFPKNLSPQGKFNSNRNKYVNTQYPPRHGSQSNLSYSNAPTDSSANAASRSEPPPHRGCAQSKR